MKKVLAEDAESSQIIHIFIGEIQILDVIDYLFQSGHDGIAAFVRVVPEEHVKDDSLVFLCLKIALHHSKLIEIREQGEILCAHDIFPLFILYGRRNAALARDLRRRETRKAGSLPFFFFTIIAQDSVIFYKF